MQDIQDKINNGEEYLFPGRRNFFSPIVHYKAAKARFYNEDGTYFSQSEVPLERWEVDMLCADNKLSSSVVWNSMPQNQKPKKRRSFEEMEADCAKMKNTNILPTKVPEDNLDINYCDSIFNMSVSDIYEDDNYEADDITIKNLIDTSLEKIDQEVKHPLQKAELLEEIAKLDTILNEPSHLEINNRQKVFSEYHEIIEFHYQRQLNLKKSNSDTKMEIKNTMKLIKDMNKNKINQFKEFKYDDLELAAGTHFQRSNIVEHIDHLVNTLGEINDENYFERFEKKIFLFLEGNYQIKRRQRVCLIPSGGGKTTLFKKYHKYLMDIDYLRVLNNDDEYFEFVMMYSRTFNRWHVINTYWKYILFKFQKFFSSRILLCHSIHQLPFFTKGLQLAAFIPRKNEDYNTRFFKENSESIRNETSVIFHDHINLGFLRIYEYFMVHSFEYEHHQFYMNKKIISDGTKNDLGGINYILI